MGIGADLHAYWPKLRDGGIMAGHDYIYASEHHNWPDDDYSLNSDGTTDPYRRSVKGAVDEFFTNCVPRQLSVTYREPTFNGAAYPTWIVRK